VGQRVGIRIRGRGRLGLVGSLSNTFTGDVFVLDGSALSLRKDNGAVAVQGNIYVKNGSNLTLDKSNQIAKNSILLLDNSVYNFFNLDYYNTPIFQSLRRVTIEGNSSVDFSPYDYRQSFLFDDILINYNSFLTINSWRDKFHFFLVRKDSEHLYDALARIKFGGYSGSKAELKDYDADYWEIIPAFPEPSIYGAILGAVGLGLVAWRRRGQNSAK